jgi:hypothetical protein
LVADDYQGVEAETPAALDHRGAAANFHHAFFQAVLADLASIFRHEPLS